MSKILVGIDGSERGVRALGRGLFGSLAHSVLMNLEVPTVVVSRE